jgi:hypothetical protein
MMLPGRAMLSVLDLPLAEGWKMAVGLDVSTKLELPLSPCSGLDLLRFWTENI